MIFVNLVHYHNARLVAFAAKSEIKPEVIEVAGRDVLPVLQHGASDSPDYTRHTLCPEIDSACCDPRSVRRELYERLNKTRPVAVCVNGWSLPGSIPAIEWAIKNDAAIVLMSDSTAQDQRRVWWKELIKRRIVRICGAGFVAGKPHAEYLNLLGMPRDHIFLGYDVVDNAYFSERVDSARRQREQLRIQTGLPKEFFLACARFESSKNLATLLTAYAIYRRRSGEKAWSLVIVGDGVLRAELQRLSKELEIESSVVFAGLKQYHEITDYYALAGAFVHTSVRETWGLVINEAMASGLPVLVSNRCGCVTDLVQDGVNGYAFDPNDIGSLAELMGRISSNHIALSEMGKQSRAIIARWSLETHATALHSAIDAARKAPLTKPTLLDRILLKALCYRLPENSSEPLRLGLLSIPLYCLYTAILFAHDATAFQLA